MSWIGSRNSPQKDVWRARIVLLSADGLGTMAIQRQTGKGKPTIWRWQAWFMAKGVAGLLHDATRPGRKKPLPAARIEQVVAMTLAGPPGEATHWTGRALAKAAGISLRSVQRIWAAHGLQPPRVRTFKLSSDPKFAAKVQDVIGLYINPPEHALVLSVDEKSQIQALDRTQPGLPMKRGRCGTMTHDYKTPRHHYPVRRPQRPRRQGHRPVHEPPSTAFCEKPMPIPNPSSGPPTPMPSSKRSAAGNKC